MNNRLEKKDMRSNTCIEKKKAENLLSTNNIILRSTCNASL